MFISIRKFLGTVEMLVLFGFFGFVLFRPAPEPTEASILLSTKIGIAWLFMSVIHGIYLADGQPRRLMSLACLGTFGTFIYLALSDPIDTTVSVELSFTGYFFAGVMAWTLFVQVLDILMPPWLRKRI